MPTLTDLVHRYLVAQARLDLASVRVEESWDPTVPEPEPAHPAEPEVAAEAPDPGGLDPDLAARYGPDGAEVTLRREYRSLPVPMREAFDEEAHVMRNIDRLVAEHRARAARAAAAASMTDHDRAMWASAETRRVGRELARRARPLAPCRRGCARARPTRRTTMTDDKPEEDEDAARRRRIQAWLDETPAPPEPPRRRRRRAGRGFVGSRRDTRAPTDTSAVRSDDTRPPTTRRTAS